MQQIRSKTGGGVGAPPLEALDPDELTTAQAAKLMAGRQANYFTGLYNQLLT